MNAVEGIEWGFNDKDLVLLVVVVVVTVGRIFFLTLFLSSATLASPPFMTEQEEDVACTFSHFLHSMWPDCKTRKTRFLTLAIHIVCYMH